MKKVGIITLSGHNNYGNKLQNYALSKTIEKKGFIVETIWVNSCFDGNIFTSFLRHIKHNISKCKDDRTMNFIKFNNEFIPMSDIKINFYTNLKLVDKRYDYFITGSDQVWNYNLTHNFDLYFLEKFNVSKNISYAASFAIDTIPNNMKKSYKNGINSIKHISVREDRGKGIIEELTGRKDVEVLLDPTMLLTSEEWDKVSKKPTMLKKDKFILNYFLGELSEERKKEIDRVAKENDCEVINILDKKSPFYECGPSEFLYLEKNAFLICTDSFHSSVFAILYNTPFLVFEREDKTVSMNSRIETLLSKFKLEDRKYKGKIPEKDLKCDYKEAYKILDKERIKSDKFLKRALDIKDSDNNE